MIDELPLRNSNAYPFDLYGIFLRDYNQDHYGEMVCENSENIFDHTDFSYLLVIITSDCASCEMIGAYK